MKFGHTALVPSFSTSRKSRSSTPTKLKCITLAILLGLSTYGPSAQAVQLKSKAAILYDYSGNALIFSKNAQARLAPANLTKLMTAVVVQQAIRAEEISPDTKLKVSEHAWRTGGAPARVTTMFARLGSEISVADLLQGLVVQSANDAAIVLAEGLEGSEEQFAQRMNKAAETIGMFSSNFTNPTGYPDASHLTTLEDLAVLANYVLEHEPELLNMYTTESFTWNRIRQLNKNPLLREIEGLDGFGAGYSETEGFAALGTLNHNGKRYVAAIAAAPTLQDRVLDLKTLLRPDQYGLKLSKLYDSGEVISTAQVYGGLQKTVPLKTSETIATLLNPSDKDGYKLRVVYDGPLQAPVKKGMEVGELQVLSKNDVIYRASLVTGEDVAIGGLRDRAWDAFGELLYQMF